MYLYYFLILARKLLFNRFLCCDLRLRLPSKRSIFATILHRRSPVMRNSGHFSKLKDVDISYILYVRDIGAVILLSQQRASGLTEARTKKKRKQFGARMRSFRVDSSRVLNFLSYNNL